MTRSIGVVDRMRWMSALAAAAFLTLVLSLTLHAAGGQLHAFAPTPAPQPNAPASSGSGGSTAPLDPRIAKLAQQRPAQLVEAIVQFKPAVAATSARSDVARAGGRVFGELHIIHALAVKLTAAHARNLGASADVHSVALNTVVKPSDHFQGGENSLGGLTPSNLQTTYDQTLGAPLAWRYRATGSGVGVAVIDTGIAGDLPDFRSGDGGGSRVVETAVTNPNAQTATDGYGHGTDVAGIIAGNGANRDPSDPLYGQYIGVAPNANLISIKASDESGDATVLDVIYGLQFAVDHQSDYNIRVINLSLDSTTPQSYTTSPLDAAAEAAWFHGIVVVAAAGNRGSAPDAVQFAPANDPYVITVGATNENGSPDPSGDTIADWSSRGTTQDGFQKPDVYAPGAHIVSVLAPNSAFASMCSACIVGGQYIRTGGTSMATPMISGLVADMLQAYPHMSPDQVKGTLTSSGAASNNAFQLVSVSRLLTLRDTPTANTGLTPSTLIGDGAGGIDYTRSSWSRSRWSVASGALSAGFARSSWSCTCSTTSADGVDPTRSRWSRSSWSTYLEQ